MIKTASGQSQSAVFEYVDPTIAEGVVNGMNKLDIAGNKLAVQRVPISSAAMLLKPSTVAATVPTPTTPTANSNVEGRELTFGSY